MNMPKRRNKSISLKGEVYDRLRKFCNREGISMAQFVEALVADVGKGE